MWFSAVIGSVPPPTDLICIDAAFGLFIKHSYAVLGPLRDPLQRRLFFGSPAIWLVGTATLGSLRRPPPSRGERSTLPARGELGETVLTFPRTRKLQLESASVFSNLEDSETGDEGGCDYIASGGGSDVARVADVQHHGRWIMRVQYFAQRRIERRPQRKWESHSMGRPSSTGSLEPTTHTFPAQKSPTIRTFSSRSPPVLSSPSSQPSASLPREREQSNASSLAPSLAASTTSREGDTYGDSRYSMSSRLGRSLRRNEGRRFSSMSALSAVGAGEVGHPGIPPVPERKDSHGESTGRRLNANESKGTIRQVKGEQEQNCRYEHLWWIRNEDRHGRRQRFAVARSGE
ncbi:hypothetical protein BKA70DRAFT_1244169 [Coprinopsis sp. MPI-PUGE-AT-0042]|nr:hypothetical protein BKA70DRAFT_1244169 [Coprinopsis sp. MPI-PUGE-AT-0042]